MAEIILARMVGRQQRKDTDVRVCASCPENGPQPIENFRTGRNGAGGYRKNCKACVTKKRKAMEAERKLFDPF